MLISNGGPGHRLFRIFSTQFILIKSHKNMVLFSIHFKNIIFDWNEQPYTLFAWNQCSHSWMIQMLCFFNYRKHLFCESLYLKDHYLIFFL